jgi:hypothetical protein
LKHLTTLINKQNKLNNKTYYKTTIIFKNYEYDLLNSSEFDDLYTSYLSDSVNDSFVNSKYNQFESYLTVLNLFNLNNSANRYSYKYSFSLLSKFVPFLIKNGQKLKTINNVLKSFSQIYRSLNSTNEFNDYAFIKEFKYYILTSVNTNNINYLLN